VVQEGHSVLLFCSSRKACETSAKHVAKFLPDHAVRLRNTISGPESAAAALEELAKCPSGLDPVLAETLPKGIAYHHAGLTVCRFYSLNKRLLQVDQWKWSNYGYFSVYLP
jgi:DNA polymerase theta